MASIRLFVSLDNKLIHFGPLGSVCWLVLLLCIGSAVCTTHFFYATARNLPDASRETMAIFSGFDGGEKAL